MISNTLNNILVWWHKDNTNLSSELQSGSKQLQSVLNIGSRIDVKKILNLDNVEQPLPNGEKPLNYAIRKGLVEIVEEIASTYPQTLENLDHHGLTALNHALISKNAKIIKIILDNKLKINFKLEDFSSSSLENEVSFPSLVTEYCKPETLLDDVFTAALNGNLDYFANVLQKDLDINIKTINGWSLLHLATKSGNAELVKLLIEKGAHVEATTDKNCISALHLAAMGNNSEIMKCLLNAGAKVDKADKNGSTPLHYAMTKDNLFSAQFLIEKKADCEKENTFGMSPLSIMFAVARSQTDKKDELKISTLDYMMFGGIAASIFSVYFPENALFNVLSYAATLVPMAMGLKRQKTILGTVGYLCTMGLSVTPGLNVVAQAWKTYAVAQQSYQSVRAAWNYRHLETARPIIKAVILGVNTAYSATQFCKSFNKTHKIIAESIESQRHSVRWQNGVISEFATERSLQKSEYLYAFKRISAEDVSTQNIVKAREAFATLKTNHNQTNIDFNKNSLSPFDDAGTCSAMALDFIARMQNECTKLIDSEKFIDCVKDQRAFYRSNTEEFSSVQSAFNTIEVKDDTFQVLSDVIATKKMQSLASYHKMILTPVTRTMQRAENVKKVIEMLPEGSYVVRLLQPSGNHKLENYGHTMGFIKREDRSIFYDNSKGARIIEKDIGASVMQNLDLWPYIPTVKFYKAECPDEGCSNLSLNIPGKKGICPASLPDQYLECSANPSETYF